MPSALRFLELNGEEEGRRNGRPAFFFFFFPRYGIEPSDYCDTFFFLSCSDHSSSYFAFLLPSISLLPLSSPPLLFPQSARTVLSSSITVNFIFFSRQFDRPYSLLLLHFLTSSQLSPVSLFPLPGVHAVTFFFHLPVTRSSGSHPFLHLCPLILLSIFDLYAFDEPASTYTTRLYPTPTLSH